MLPSQSTILGASRAPVGRGSSLVRGRPVLVLVPSMLLAWGAGAGLYWCGRDPVFVATVLLLAGTCFLGDLAGGQAGVMPRRGRNRPGRPFRRRMLGRLALVDAAGGCVAFLLIVAGGWLAARSGNPPGLYLLMAAIATAWTVGVATIPLASWRLRRRLARHGAGRTR